MADADRERLIEILKLGSCPSPYLCDENCKYANLERCYEERTADLLLEHGIIVSPCKVGNMECPQCERKRYIYTIPDVPPSLNKFAGRENVWAYRADKKQWEALCAVYCRPKPDIPIKKCVVRITYFFRTRQRHDPDNYNGKFILDGLRAAGIIEDDSFRNVELQLCGNYDKNNPRTEIEVIL